MVLHNPSRSSLSPIVVAAGKIPLVVPLASVLPSAAQGGLRNQDSVSVCLPSFDGVATGCLNILHHPEFGYMENQLGVVQLAGDWLGFHHYRFACFGWCGTPFGYPQLPYP